MPEKKLPAISRILSSVIFLHTDSVSNDNEVNIFIDTSRNFKSVRNESDWGMGPSNRLASSLSDLRCFRSCPSVEGRVDENWFKPKSSHLSIVSVLIGSMGPVSVLRFKSTVLRCDSTEISFGNVPTSRLPPVLGFRGRRQKKAKYEETIDQHFARATA